MNRYEQARRSVATTSVKPCAVLPKKRHGPSAKRIKVVLLLAMPRLLLLLPLRLAVVGEKESIQKEEEGREEEAEEEEEEAEEEAGSDMGPQAWGARDRYVKRRLSTPRRLHQGDCSINSNGCSPWCKPALPLQHSQKERVQNRW